EPNALTVEELDAAMADPDAWVQAAVAVAGSRQEPRWPRVDDELARLRTSSDVIHRAAAVWAASFMGDHETVAAAFTDADARVRLEGVRSFAKMKAGVPGAAPGLIACLRDEDVEVRRAALKEAIRWTPASADEDAFGAALVDALGSGDDTVRRLAAEAMAAQSPGALRQAM